jgi:hypothetical protein
VIAAAALAERRVPEVHGWLLERAALGAAAAGA